jgi:hypothetical protein
MTRLLNTPRLVVCLIFLLFIHSASAQDFEWVKQFGANGNNTNGLRIANDKWGNVFCLGTFTGTVDFDPGPGSFTLSASNASTYLLKLDSAGTFLWAQNLHSYASALTIDKYGNVFVAGGYGGANSTVSIVPGAPAFTGIGSYVLKLNPTGSFVFVKTFVRSGYCNIASIAVDSAQNIYTSGDIIGGPIDFDPGPGTYTLTGNTVGIQSVGSVDINTFFIAGLDSSGAFLFAKVKSSVSWQSKVIPVPGGVVAIAAEGSYPYNNLNSISLQKYSPAGNLLWSKTIQKPSSLSSIATDRNNNLYLIGTFWGTVDFDPGTGTVSISSTGNYEASIFILKLDSAGNFKQVQKLDGPGSNANAINASRIITDPAENAYISGSFKGSIDFAPNIGQTVTLNSTNGSGFILKLDKFGEFAWVKQVGENSNCSVNDIALDNFGNIYTTGSFTGTADFDPTGTYNLSAYGSSDAFVHKLSGPLITGMAEQTLKNELSLYPNPTSALAYLNTTVALDRAICRLMDLSGRTAQEKRNISGTSFEIDLSAQPRGLYLLEVSDSRSISRVKLIKE